MTDSTLGIALDLVRKGISVIPLDSNKKPLIRWEDYQKRLPTEAEVKEWFKDGSANIGVVCGSVSGGLVAVDFETREAFEKFFSDDILSHTLVVSTPHGGIHVWLRETGEAPRRSIRISKDPPIDLLGEGGYAVFPPSIIDHARCDKAKCKFEGIGEYKVISKTNDIMKTSGTLDFVVRRCKQLGYSVQGPKPKVEDILTGVEVGRRNDSAFQYARYLLFKVGLDKTTALAELKRWNLLNDPPLPESEIKTVWESAQKYPFAHDEEAKENTEGKAQLYDLAKKIVEDCPMITDRRTFLTYRLDVAQGVWRDDAESVIQQILIETEGNSYKQAHLQALIQIVQALTFVDRIEEPPPNFICVENGVLDTDTMEMRPPSRDLFFRHMINVKYDPEAKCPKFLKWLEETLPQPEARALAQEMFGYCLYREYPFHKLFFLVGTGGNGKGTLMRTLEGILGSRAFASVPLDRLGERFQATNLMGKMVNVVSEPKTSLLSTEMIKQLTGQDLISAEIKGKQKLVEFKNYAKIIVMANRLPPVSDSTDAWWRRVVVIEFPVNFRDRMMPNIEKTWLEDPKERSGILNWSLEGLKRILANNGFTKSDVMDRAVEQYKKWSQPVQYFLEKYCEFNPNYWTVKEELYNRYKEVCDAESLMVVAFEKFGSEIRKKNVMATQKRIGGRRTWVWVGVRFNYTLYENEAVSNTLENALDDKAVTGVTGCTGTLYPAICQCKQKNIESIEEPMTPVTPVTISLESKEHEAPDTPETQTPDPKPSSEAGATSEAGGSEMRKKTEVVRLSPEEMFGGKCECCGSITAITGYINGKQACQQCLARAENQENLNHVCQDCMHWSDMRCLVHTEKVVVFPTHVSCEDFSLKKEAKA